MFKIYSKTFTLSDGNRDEATIQVNGRFKAARLSFSSITDKVYLGLKVDDRDYFSPDLLNISALKSDAGNAYIFVTPFEVEAKKTLSIKVLNGTGGAISNFTVAFHGDEE